MAYYNKYDSDSSTLKSEWNCDDAILKQILLAKYQFQKYLSSWDLNNAYFTLREIWSEIDAKFKAVEQEFCEETMNELEIKRNEWIKNQNKMKGEFYHALQKVYMLMNRLMKKHGLYFREHDDSGL